MRKTIRAASLAVLVGLAGAACTTTRAATPVERPALEVPPPPPRVVVPLPGPPTNQLEPVQELGPVTPAPPNRTRSQRDKEPPKAEPKPEEPKPVEPPPTAPIQPPPQLRLPDGSGSPQVSQIIDAIARSKKILKAVGSSGQLTEGAKKALKEADLFVAQAEEALKADNLPLAKEFADKAERIAKELQR